MKYYLIAGETSGDLHGSNLMAGIRKQDQDAEFRFFGGDMMKDKGGTLVIHYSETAFMGLFDVLGNIRTILLNMAFCRKDILEYSPDALILIDYPGFNLRMAKFARRKGITVFYYISPKVWVWKKSRIPLMKKYINRLFVIFPFEVDFFRSHGLEAEYFGNPLKDAIAGYRKENKRGEFMQGKLFDEEEKPVVALLCGSRIQEIKHCLPEMLKASHSFPGFRFIVAGVKTVEEKVYRKILDGNNVELLMNATYPLLEKSFAAIVTSGTATLETALFKVPQVVIYKTGWITYYLGRLFVKLQFFSLVNIIAGKEVVKEILQMNLAERIKAELEKITGDQEYRRKMVCEYDNIDKVTGEEGVSEKIGARIVQLTQNLL